MLERTSAEEIGQYGYTHWTHSPVTPEVHNIAFVPQTVADGWDAYCSCGEWRGFASFYEFSSRHDLLAALTGAWEKHRDSGSHAEHRDTK